MMLFCCEELRLFEHVDAVLVKRERKETDGSGNDGTDDFFNTYNFCLIFVMFVFLFSFLNRMRWWLLVAVVTINDECEK